MDAPNVPSRAIAWEVLGVDACRRGWIGLRGDLKGFFGPTIGELMALATRDSELKVIAIDIPIGLPVSGPRQADMIARSLVGKRASSVFPTPLRSALAAPTHAEASAISLGAIGKSLSAQSYALRKKILEVDKWVPTSPVRVIEVHPEVSFATMSGFSLAHSKSTWAGAEERRRLLVHEGIEIPGDVGVAGEKASVDDVLDAAAAMWTASRFVRGEATSHPAEPEARGDGHEAAIWA